VYTFLFSEVFISLKDHSTFKKMITLTPPEQLKQNNKPIFINKQSKISGYSALKESTSVQSHQIVKELMYEFFNRLIKAMNEPKIKGTFENSDI
jgi:hypothetical protein